MKHVYFVSWIGTAQNGSVMYGSSTISAPKRIRNENDLVDLAKAIQRDSDSAKPVSIMCYKRIGRSKE